MSVERRGPEGVSRMYPNAVIAGGALAAGGGSTMQESVERPPQSQPRQPGREHMMAPRPCYEPRFRGSGRLDRKVALITGGDSGIGRAGAVLFAREGADIAIVFLEEDRDARETCALVEGEGRQALLIEGDIGDEAFCRQAVDRTIERFGRLDVLVNNAAEQHPKRRWRISAPNSSSARSEPTSSAMSS
jgi:short chain dehydrogenase